MAWGSRDEPPCGDIRGAAGDVSDAGMDCRPCPSIASLVGFVLDEKPKTRKTSQGVFPATRYSGLRHWHGVEIVMRGSSLRSVRLLQGDRINCVVRGAFNGQAPTKCSPIFSGKSWVAQLSDGAVVTFRVAGDASAAPDLATATVEVNSAAVKATNNGKVAKFKFPNQ